MTRSHHCGSVAFAVFVAAACIPCGMPSRAVALRPDSEGTDQLFRFAEDDIVEHYDSPSGSFRMHFTRMGTNAVPMTDADETGIPDHVEQLAIIYEEVLAFYQGELGLRAPLSDESILDNGGDARFDVYLVDFAGRADGAFRTDHCDTTPTDATQCIGFIVQENDFRGYSYPSTRYANRLLASHEFFHAVQAAYDSNEDTVFSEGTAVWGSEAFDSSLRDLELFSDGYLDRPERPLDQPLPGPIDPFSYGSSIFFRFLEERFERSVIAQLLEAAEEEPWLMGLDFVLSSYDSSFSEAFLEFTEWNLFTEDRADPSRSYEGGAAYAPVRIEPIELPYRSASPLRVFHASAQYFGADPGARAEVTAALVGDAAGLQLVVATRESSSIEIAASLPVDTMSAHEIIVVVINPEMEGPSRRPGLCIGSPTEVSSCVASFEAMPDAGANGSDAGVDDAGMPPMGAPDCTCSVPQRSGRAWPSWLFMLVALGVVLRRSAASKRTLFDERA